MGRATYCPHCGEAIAGDGALFCADCGRRLDGDAADADHGDFALSVLVYGFLAVAVVAVLAAAAYAAGWFDDEDRDYPASVRANFINSCVRNGGGRDNCGCMIGEIEDQFTLGEFVERESRYAVTGVIPAEFVDAASDC